MGLKGLITIAISLSCYRQFSRSECFACKSEYNTQNDRQPRQKHRAVNPSFYCNFLHVLYMTALTINYFCSSCWIIKKNYKHLTVFKFWTFSMQLMQSKTLSITGKLGKNTASDPITIASSMSYTWLLIVPSLKNFWIVHYYPFEVNYLKVSDWARSKEEFITG